MYSILKFWSSVDSEPCLFKMLNVKKIWDVPVAVTNRQYRNLGLIAALLACSIEEALLNDDVSIIRGLCVYNVMAKLFKNSGMECAVDKHVTE